MEETWPRRQAGRTAASPRHRWPFENTETSSIAAEAATTNPPSGFSGQEMLPPAVGLTEPYDVPPPATAGQGKRVT